MKAASDSLKLFWPRSARMVPVEYFVVISAEIAFGFTPWACASWAKTRFQLSKPALVLPQGAACTDPGHRRNRGNNNNPTHSRLHHQTLPHDCYCPTQTAPRSCAPPPLFGLERPSECGWGRARFVEVGGEGGKEGRGGSRPTRGSRRHRGGPGGPRPPGPRPGPGRANPPPPGGALGGRGLPGGPRKVGPAGGASPPSPRRAPGRGPTPRGLGGPPACARPWSARPSGRASRPAPRRCPAR